MDSFCCKDEKQGLLLFILTLHCDFGYKGDPYERPEAPVLNPKRLALLSTYLISWFIALSVTLESNMKRYVKSGQALPYICCCSESARCCRHCCDTDLPAAEVSFVLEEDRDQLLLILFTASCRNPCPLFHFSYRLHSVVFHPPFLFVNKFNKALAEVIKVKDLDVQNFYGSLDLSIQAIPVLQRVTQVLLRVLDATFQVRVSHLHLLKRTVNTEKAEGNIRRFTRTR